MWYKWYNGYRMYWYQILRVGLIIQILISIANIADFASSESPKLTVIMVLSIILALIVPILRGLLLYKMSCYTYNAYWYTLPPIVYALLLTIALTLLPAYEGNSLFELGTSALSAIAQSGIIGECILFLPSFFYIRRRVSGEPRWDCAPAAPEEFPSPPHASSQFCRFCGNPLKADSAFCDKCGKQL